MKRVNKEDLRLIHSALTHFVGGMISAVDDNLGFETADGGVGFIEKRSDGTYEIFVNDESVYVVEGEFFDIINYDHTKDHLIDLYERLTTIDPDRLKYRSRSFYWSVKTSMESIILNMNLPLEGNVRIGNYQMFYTPEHKFKVNLN